MCNIKLKSNFVTAVIEKLEEYFFVVVHLFGDIGSILGLDVEIRRKSTNIVVSGLF